MNDIRLSQALFTMSIRVLTVTGVTVGNYSYMFAIY
jgi:hypothetical protein